MKYFIFFFLFSTVLCVTTYAQKIIPTKTDQRQGFERSYFTFNGREAFIIKPKKSLEGNPWVWKATFPDWHTETDSILLARGFHIAYINTDNMYGAPSAIMIWDRFYDYLVHQKDFAPRVALEDASRSGLYMYAWAKLNPEHVSCILAEVPVCDFKSWPGAKGKSKGDLKNWKELLKVYGFKSEEEALLYQDNPIDNLEGLAAYKVPLRHLIGLNDKIVPPEENTFILMNKYLRLGGPFSVYPMTRSKEEMDGHHFDIEQPADGADFIMRHSYPVKKPLNPGDFTEFRNGMPNFKKAVLQNRVVNVAFLGGSITYNKGWRPKTIAYIKKLYPNTKFRFLSAGIPSLGSLPHVFRMKSAILDSAKADLMFVECAVNDNANGTDSLTQLKDLEGIVRQAKKSNPKMDLVMMAFADPNKLKDYAQHKIPLEVKNQELIAAYYHLPSLNLAKELFDKIQAKEFSWEFDIKDLHPAAYGQELYFAAIKNLIYQNEFQQAQQVSSNLPKAIIKGSFQNGDYVAISKATLGEGWQIEPKWKAKDGKEMREGFFDIPILTSELPGSTFTFSFKGNAVGLSVLSGPDAGTISYQIDHGPIQTMSLFTEWSPSLHLPWYLLLADGLKEGMHTLKLTVGESKDVKSLGHAVRIAHFLVNSPK